MYAHIYRHASRVHLHALPISSRWGIPVPQAAEIDAITRVENKTSEGVEVCHVVGVAAGIQIEARVCCWCRATWRHVTCTSEVSAVHSQGHYRRDSSFHTMKSWVPGCGGVVRRRALCEVVVACPSDERQGE